MNPAAGNVLEHNLVGADKGDVWTGYEWVTPERYDELRATTMPGLPPIQGTARTVLWDEPCRANITPPICPSERDGYPDRPRIAEAIYDLLQVVDPNPNRGGLRETPDRAAKAWQDWTSGYGMDPASVLKVFEDGAEGCNEMVVVHDIPVYSHCEHHLAPIFGTATVAYLPDRAIVGLSKLPRLVDVFARRLQVQERLTNQVADAIMAHLAPHGCGVVIKARHMCMESRGIKQAGGHTTTSALRGAFKEDPTVRAEFLALAHGGRHA